MGRALDGCFPTWAAAGVQGLLVLPLVLAFAYLCGGI